MDKQITIRMPKDMLEKWLAALRSGEYKQAANVLHDEIAGGYCCLGVLQHCVSGQVVEEMDESLPDMDWLRDRHIDFFGRFNAESNDPWLPTRATSAASLNDGGAPFAEIADAIEACAEGV